MFEIGDRVICPEYPYLGEMQVVKIYETPKKVEFIAKGNTVVPFVQGTAKLFTLCRPEINQLTLF